MNIEYDESQSSTGAAHRRARAAVRDNIMTDPQITAERRVNQTEGERCADGAEPPLPSVSEDGVDLGLIRWYISLTPAQRLETLQNFVNFVVEARNAREAGAVRRPAPRS